MVAEGGTLEASVFDPHEVVTDQEKEKAHGQRNTQGRMIELVATTLIVLMYALAVELAPRMLTALMHALAYMMQIIYATARLALQETRHVAAGPSAQGEAGEQHARAGQEKAQRAEAQPAEARHEREQQEGTRHEQNPVAKLHTEQPYAKMLPDKPLAALPPSAELPHTSLLSSASMSSGLPCATSPCAKMITELQFSEGRPPPEPRTIGQMPLARAR